MPQLLCYSIFIPKFGLDNLEYCLNLNCYRLLRVVSNKRNLAIEKFEAMR